MTNEKLLEFFDFEKPFIFLFNSIMELQLLWLPVKVIFQLLAMLTKFCRFLIEKAGKQYLSILI